MANENQTTDLDALVMASFKAGYVKAKMDALALLDGVAKDYGTISRDTVIALIQDMELKL